MIENFLLNLCHGDTGKEDILLPLDKSVVAARLCMQPETLSRALNKLKKHGVASCGRRVRIRDIHRLREVLA